MSTGMKAKTWAWLAFTVAMAWQALFLAWTVPEAAHQGVTCAICDTGRYFESANAFSKSGLLFANPFDGYRSYFFPMFIAAVTALASSLGSENNVAVQYTYTVAPLFSAISLALFTWAWQTAGPRTAICAGAATLFNPFLIVQLPYALQESALMFFCLPLLFVWMVLPHSQASWRAALLLIVGLLAYVIRSSLIWWLLPAAAYATWQLFRTRKPYKWKGPLLAVTVAGLMALGPQVYIAKKKFDSFNPYPSTSLLSNQISWGISVLKFTAVEDNGHWRQLAYFSPFAPEAEETKSAQFYFKNPERGALLVLSHVFAGFHYDQIRPYWRLENASLVTVWLLLSSSLVFLGCLHVAQLLTTRTWDSDDAFAIATAVLCAGALAFVAAEARFGITGFAALSILLSRRFMHPGGLAWPKGTTGGLLAYLALSFLFNAMLMHSADIRI
jgi:hypothetical protein